MNKFSKVRNYLLISILLFLGMSLIPSPASAESIHYIRAGATGTNDGSDWNNAWTNLNTVPWVRGDVYYVASGMYVGDSSGFWTGVVHIDKLENGTQWIYIRKAIPTDHGADTGWQSSYGIGSADIMAKLAINNSYIEVDGQEGSDNSVHGFRVINPVVGGNVVTFEWEKSNIHLYHTEVKGSGSSGTVPYGKTQENGVYVEGSNPRSGIEISYCWIHDVNRDGLALAAFNGSPGFLFDHNRLERTGNHADPDAHGQGIQFQGINNGITIRYNQFIDISGSANISFLGGTTNSDVKIYGNIFWTTDRALYTSSPGVIWSRGSTPAVTMNGLYVYNNTFHGVGLAQIANDAAVSSNVYVRNNIWEDSSFSGGAYYRGAIADHNYFYNNHTFSYSNFSNTSIPVSITLGPTDKLGTSSPFVNATSHDYHLVPDSLAKDTRASLGSPYDTDIDSTSHPQGTVATYNFGSATLRNGSRGEAVKELQRFLNFKLNLGLVVDGKLGPKTIIVIKKWQKDNGLVADGLVGAKTKVRMNAVVN